MDVATGSCRTSADRITTMHEKGKKRAKSFFGAWGAKNQFFK
jgi:hypothetical protein